MRLSGLILLFFSLQIRFNFPNAAAASCFRLFISSMSPSSVPNFFDCLHFSSSFLVSRMSFIFSVFSMFIAKFHDLSMSAAFFSIVSITASDLLIKSVSSAYMISFGIVASFGGLSMADLISLSASLRYIGLGLNFTG